MNLKPGRVHVNIDSSHWGGDYVADLWRVQSKLSLTHRQLVNECIELWPEISQHVEARKQLRRLPKFVLAIILTQI